MPVTRAASRRSGAEEPPVTSSDADAPSPPSRSPSCNPNSMVASDGVDAFAQALKALSDRSPFDEEDALARVTNLPAVLAKVQSKPFHGRKKRKKAHGETGGFGPFGFWDSVEDCFRAVGLADVEKLVVPRVTSGSGSIDSCFLVPEIGCCSFGTEDREDLDTVSLSSVTEVEELLPKCEEVEQVEKTEEGVVERSGNCVLETVELDSDVVVFGNEELVEDEGADGTSALNWLLGSRERFIVTSERPSKKRKLLGRDAGLDRLLLLPNLRMGAVCDFCCLGDTRMKSNKLLCCDSCKVSVHQKCYGAEAQGGVWLCEWCMSLGKVDKASKQVDQIQSSMVCMLCPKESGALKHIRTDPCGTPNNARQKFAHLFCSLWAPEVYVEDDNLMNLVMNKGIIQTKHKNSVCDVCRVKHGVCVRCSHGTCRTSFHPLCARDSKHQIEIWGKFGSDDIELRIFCLKHSTFEDTSNAKVGIQKDVKLTSDCDTLVAKLLPSPKVIPAKKLPKIRFTCSNRDKNRTEPEDSNQSPGEIIKMEENSPCNSLPSTQGADCKKISARKMDSDLSVEHRQVQKNVLNIAVILKRLIDRGRIEAGDVALQMDISPDTLQSILMGKTTTFSSELTLKIIKWLKCSTNVLGLPPSKLRSHVMEVGSPDPVKDADLDGVCDDLVHDVVLSDTVHTKSPPPHTLMENKNQILGDGEALSFPKGNISPNNVKCKITNDLKSSNVNSDAVESHSEEARHCGTYHTCFSREEDPQKGTLLEAHEASEHCPHSPLRQQEGNNANGNNMEFSDVQIEKFLIEESFISSLPDIDGAGDANDTEASAMDKTCPLTSGSNTDLPFPTSLVSKFSTAGSSYIHPFIKEKLVRLENHVFSNLNEGDKDGNGLTDKAMLKDIAASQRTSSFLPTNSDFENLPLLSESKCTSILDHSPDDEVEAEIVYLQAILLDKAAVVRKNSVDLVQRVVQKLPEEQNLINKQEWEFALVNQYLRELKEAKKHVRRDSRHKDAQSLLSTTASASASVSLGNANAVANSASQEIPSKVNFRSRRAELHCPLVPRSKKLSKLASTKASLEKQGLVFQIPDFSKDSALSCDICMRTETVINRISSCSNCKATVHLGCYRKIRNPITSWKCDFCQEVPLQSSSLSGVVEGRSGVCAMPTCGLCGGTSGAFRKSTDGHWVHAFCAEWLLESKFRRGQENLVEGMETVSKKKVICCICLKNVGACLQCSYINCLVNFHPLCARDAGFYLNVKSTGNGLEHKAYCEKHSIEKLEADNLQYRTEEHKNMKQIRVELEKLRLLLERIIKREKLKRDLVVCSHNILASRRDSAAHSIVLRSSCSSTGFSSESGITSINNKSFSCTVQQPDDTTMGSASSGKRTIKISLHCSDIERNTDEVSNFKVSIKRKLNDRTSVGGKQLPQKSGSQTVENFTEDGEQKLKTSPQKAFKKSLS